MVLALIRNRFRVERTKDSRTSRGAAGPLFQIVQTATGVELHQVVLNSKGDQEKDTLVGNFASEKAAEDEVKRRGGHG